MTYVPIMAQYIESGMTSPLGTVQHVEDQGDDVRVNFYGDFHVVYPAERPVFVEIDLEAA